MRSVTIRFTGELEAPTAASASSPAKRPTTMISAALKRSCRSPENITGIANLSIFLSIGPLVISISYLLDLSFVSISFDIKNSVQHA